MTGPMIRAALPARAEARRLLIGTLISAIGQGMTLPFLFIYLTEVRHLSSTVVGLVVGWMGLCALLLAGPGGALVDRFGPRRVLLPLYFVNGIGVASYAWVHAAWQAFLSASMVAVGVAALWSASNTLMAAVTTEDERQRVFGLNFALLNFGIGSGGLIAGFIADVHHLSSFQLIYYVNGAAMIAPVLVLLSLPGIGGPSVAEHVGAREHAGYREVFASKAFRRFVVFMLLITVSGYAQIEIGYPAFGSLVGGVSTRVIAWGLAANTLTIVVAQLWVLNRMHGRSRSRALAVVGLIMAMSWLLLGLSAWGRHLSSVLPVIGVVLAPAVFGFSETIMSPVLPAVTNVLATDELRGRYNAMTSMIFGITGVVGPVTAAPLIGHHLGAVWIVLIVAGSLAASATALSLHPLLTAEQDGRVAADAEPVAPVSR